MARTGALGPVGPRGPNSPREGAGRGGGSMRDAYGPPGGLPGLNGDPWKKGPDGLGYANADGSYRSAREPEVDVVSSLIGQADLASKQYMDAFQANLAKSRANIATQYATALADINAGEGRAKQAIDTLPGMLQGIYGPTAQQIDAETAKSAAAQAKTGLQSFAPAGTGVEPIKAASAAEFASRKADVPLLHLGSQQSFAGQRSTLGSAQQRALGDIESQGLEGQQAFERERIARMYQTADAYRDREWALQDMGIEKGNRKQDAIEAFRLENPEPPDKSSPEWASWLSHANPKRYKELVNSAPFRYASGQLEKGVFEADEPGLGGIAANTLTKNNPVLLQPQLRAAGVIGKGRGNLDTGYGGGMSRRKLTLQELVQKYKGNKRLVGLLRLAYGG